MPTEHFNGLTEAEQERLAILIEECGEAIQAACKVLRHGYQSRNPKWIASAEHPHPETNRQELERELGDLSHAVVRMVNSGDVSRQVIEERRRSKPVRMLPYLHHQAGSAGRS